MSTYDAILDAMDDDVNEHDFEEILKSISPEKINEICSHCDHLLYEATRSRKHDEYIKLMLKYKVDINSYDTAGYTPLHIAILRDDSKSISILLENGADILFGLKDGRLPIEIYTTDEKTILTLIDYGSPIPSRSHNDDAKNLEWKLQIINTHPKVIFNKTISVLFKRKYHHFFNIDNRDVIGEIKKYIKVKN